ncbi:CBF5 [Hepatospora eriocheir]|uniref:CBF5 n=1 Tax=Hepatospora eriocheir TaxID=1081669 RepID=A0A1X0Q7Z1_9MICR|nr:CBF5 [Hepatospora eriocheir]
MNAVEKLTGHLYQRPPLECAVKRELRLRWIYSIEVLEFYEKTALFIVKCEAGSYIRTLCVHLGLMIGCGAEMGELRRIKSGFITEDSCVTLHDLKDAFYQYRTSGDDSIIRKLLNR